MCLNKNLFSAFIHVKYSRHAKFIRKKYQVEIYGSNKGARIFYWSEIRRKRAKLNLLAYYRDRRLTSEK